MLIQVRAPRLKPAGGPVLRIRRDHPLAQELRACIILGGTVGVGVDLVSGVVLTTGGTPVPAVGEDGPAVDLNNTSYLSLAHDGSLNITEHFSLGWRGRRNSATDDFIISKSYYGASGPGEYTPWDFQISPGGNIYFVRSRQGVYQFRAWMGSASFVPTGRMISASITQGAAIEVAPRFFVDGVEDATPTSMYGGAANGAAFGNSDPVIINGYKGTSNCADAHHSLFLLAATQWDTTQHLAFAGDPYGILEDAPIYHFLSGIPPITAEGAITFADMTIAGEATYAAPSSSVHGVLRRRTRRRLWNDVPADLKPVVALAEEWADESPVQRAVDDALAKYAAMSARASAARRDRLIDDLKRAIVHAVERAAEADDEEALIALL